jgi:hypothetical protein
MRQPEASEKEIQEEGGDVVFEEGNVVAGGVGQ